MCDHDSLTCQVVLFIYQTLPVDWQDILITYKLLTNKLVILCGSHVGEQILRKIRTLFESWERTTLSHLRFNQEHDESYSPVFQCHTPKEIATIVKDKVSNVGRFLAYLEDKGCISRKEVTTQVPKPLSWDFTMQELPGTWGILQPNTEYNRRVRRGARRGDKWLTTLRSSAPSAVIFLARKYRIAIGRPINIPE